MPKKLTHEQFTERLKEKNITVEVVGKYEGALTAINCKCGVCNKVWPVLPNSLIYMGVKMCQTCKNRRQESGMARVLKMILCKELGAIEEYDIGYRGLRGGTSKYDIYLPHTNTLIECQSRLHDSRKVADEVKKLFAIQSGYNYISIDSREYSPIEAVRLFITTMKILPDYALKHIESSRTKLLREVQEDLNSNMSSKDIYI